MQQPAVQEPVPDPRAGNPAGSPVVPSPNPRLEPTTVVSTHKQESPNKDQSMDDYMASIESGGYYKVYLKNVQLGSPGLTSVTRLEKAERPS